MSNTYSLILYGEDWQMADGLQGVKLRPAEMLAKPVRVDPAFSDPDHVVQLCRDSGPYRLASAVHKMAPTGKDLP